MRLRDHHQTHLRYHNGQGAQGHVPAGSAEISHWPRRHRRRDATRQPRTQQVSRRVELRHQAERERLMIKLSLLFINGASAQPTRYVTATFAGFLVVLMVNCLRYGQIKVTEAQSHHGKHEQVQNGRCY